jgi:hypothetical protein
MEVIVQKLTGNQGFWKSPEIMEVIVQKLIENHGFRLDRLPSPRKLASDSTDCRSMEDWIFGSQVRRISSLLQPAFLLAPSSLSQTPSLSVSSPSHPKIEED